MSLEEIDLDGQIIDVILDPRAAHYRAEYRTFASPACFERGPGDWQPCLAECWQDTNGVPTGVRRAFGVGKSALTRDAALLGARAILVQMAKDGTLPTLDKPRWLVA